jgi:methanogenic corrinoid protein MtbC1
LRFVRERNGQLARPDKLGFDTAAFTLSARLSLDDAAEHAYDYLAEGLGDKLHALMTALYMRGFTVAEIADEVIRTAMSRIGMLWQGDPGGIFIEHRATFQCLTAIEELRALIPVVAGERAEPVAVTAGTAHDPYLLPSAVAAASLAEIGWRTVCLGADTPLAVVMIATHQVGARLVALSITAAPPKGFQRELTSFISSARSEGRMVAIGGQCVASLELEPRPGLFVADSMRELVRERRHGVVDQNGRVSPLTKGR